MMDGSPVDSDRSNPQQRYNLPNNQLLPAPNINTKSALSSSALMQNQNQVLRRVRGSRIRPPSRKRVFCPICGIDLLKRTLQRHIETKHQEGEGHKCGDCNKTFARADILKRHVEEQHGDEIGHVECMHCGEKIRRRALEEHFRSRKCVGSRERPSRQSDEGMSAGIALPDCSGRFGMDSTLDTVVTCAQLFATALYVRDAVLWPKDSKWEVPLIHASLPGRYYSELFELRQIVLHCVRRDLSNKCAEKRDVYPVALLYLADFSIFGGSSRPCNLPAEYPDSLTRLDGLIDIGSRLSKLLAIFAHVDKHLRRNRLEFCDVFQLTRLSETLYRNVSLKRRWFRDMLLGIARFFKEALWDFNTETWQVSNNRNHYVIKRKDDGR